MTEPVDPLEPPVAEELAVERHRQERVAAAVLAMGGERLANEADEVHGVCAHALGRGAWRIRLLRAETGLRVRDAPIPEAAAVVLPMELAIRRLTGGAHHRRPDLSGHLVVPRDRDDVRLTHEIRT